MAAEYEAVAKQFTEFYYNQFDTDRSALRSLYREDSMLTFEGAAIGGVNAIVEKLGSLPFTQVKHQIATLDAQPRPDGIMILVSGALLVDEEQRPMNYCQSFVLKNSGDGNYYVFNDVFRLIFG